MTTLSERVAADGVRFVLATFVDLTGKPCAKPVPAQAVDRLAAEGVGFAGFAAGELGQGPADPDLIAVPDPDSYLPLPFVRDGLAMVQCDPHVDGEPWPFSPPDHPAAGGRPARRTGPDRAGGGRGRVLPGAAGRGHAATGGRARPLGPALLRRPGRDPDVRAPDRGVRRGQHTGLGQLRQRPRGRQRAVRAELHPRRPADHRRPGDRLPVPGARAGRAGGDDGDVHAQAVRRPHRHRHAPAPVPAGGRDADLPRPRRRARAGPVPGGLRPLPPTLLHAVEALREDPLLLGLLDIADVKERVAGYYCERRTEEFLAWHGQVTPWEVDRYLTAF